MAKKVYAVTNIKLDSNTEFVAGEEVDVSKFSKDQLKELHDAGAIELRTGDDSKSEEKEVTSSQTTEPNPEVPDMDVADKAAPTPTKAAPTPTKATETKK